MTTDQKKRLKTKLHLSTNPGKAYVTLRTQDGERAAEIYPLCGFTPSEWIAHRDGFLNALQNQRLLRVFFLLTIIQAFANLGLLILLILTF